MSVGGLFASVTIENVTAYNNGTTSGSKDFNFDEFVADGQGDPEEQAMDKFLSEEIESAHVGNFVEVKNARLEKGAKANHLSYIGDAKVGAASG